ncbi:DinB family protein [Epilithonimonas sp.]|uniref:DinB family protein n=1 Tax=Epilithonimonas sp. TaxID=2894511 RepID=UPI00289C376B|nr:DinB family protein [Epilithonimonas sp.]
MKSQFGKSIKMFDSALDRLSQRDLEKDYPTEALGYKMTTGYFLIHLLSHLNYHLGQINYHRRLLDI